MAGGQRVARSWRAPHGQGVTFVELFFDLVFVFAVTGVTRLVIHDLTPLGVGRAVLVFWLVWWAWTQLTWALNGADTTHIWLRVGTLSATVVAFVMAISIDSAFEAGGGLWFAGPYVIVRLLGLGLYLRVAAGDAAWLRAVRSFGTLSLMGLATAVMGGLADPDERAWWWLATVVLDIIAALVGARHRDWNLYAPHFSERHGLFVIIALGESLLAAAVPSVDAERNATLVLVLVAAVGLVCAMWWTYFGWFQVALERKLAARLEERDAQFARDAYSLFHFPLVAGIVGVAVGIEAMVAHPGQVLQPPVLAAFVVGLVLFIAPAVPIWMRAGSGVLGWRVATALLLPPVVWLVRDEEPVIVLAAAVGVLALLTVGEARWRSRGVDGPVVRPQAPS